MTASRPLGFEALRFFLALALAAAVSYLAYRRRALSRGGAVAATGVGALVFEAGGVAWAAPLLFFFLTGSALTHVRRGRPRGHGAERSARQVLANGGVAALASALRMAFGPLPAWDALALGSLAAMAADTWATEVGLLSRGPVRQILTWKPLQPGASGGVSLPGTLAGLAGALATAWVASLAARGLSGLAAVSHAPEATAKALAWPAVGGAGVVGLLADSLMGAFAQAHYRCQACGELTEAPRAHRRACAGGRLVAVRGLSWLDNDAVNLLASCLGGLTALAWTLA